MESDNQHPWGLLQDAGGTPGALVMLKGPGPESKACSSGRKEAGHARMQRAVCCVEEPGKVEGTGDWGSTSPNYCVFLGKARTSLSLSFLNCQWE